MSQEKLLQYRDFQLRMQPFVGRTLPAYVQIPAAPKVMGSDGVCKYLPSMSLSCVKESMCICWFGLYCYLYILTLCD